MIIILQSKILCFQKNERAFIFHLWEVKYLLLGHLQKNLLKIIETLSNLEVS